MDEQTDAQNNTTLPRPELADLTLLASELKKKLDDYEKALKTVKDQYNAVTDTILRALELADLDSVKAHGFLFYKQTSTSVTTPKTPEEKQALFEFLQSKGIFLEIASVNSQTLNSLYKSLATEAEEKGNYDFKMPGVGEPTTYTSLKLRRQ